MKKRMPGRYKASFYPGGHKFGARDTNWRLIPGLIDGLNNGKINVSEIRNKLMLPWLRLGQSFLMVTMLAPGA